VGAALTRSRRASSGCSAALRQRLAGSPGTAGARIARQMQPIPALLPFPAVRSGRVRGPARPQTAGVAAPHGPTTLTGTDHLGPGTVYASRRRRWPRRLGVVVKWGTADAAWRTHLRPSGGGHGVSHPAACPPLHHDGSRRCTGYDRRNAEENRKEGAPELALRVLRAQVHAPCPTSERCGGSGRRASRCAGTTLPAGPGATSAAPSGSASSWSGPRISRPPRSAAGGRGAAGEG